MLSRRRGSPRAGSIPALSAHPAAARPGSSVALIQRRSLVRIQPAGPCPRSSADQSAWLRTRRSRVRIAPGVRIGLWRSLVSASASGAEGRRFESGQPDHGEASRRMAPAAVPKTVGAQGSSGFDPPLLRQAPVAQRQSNRLLTGGSGCRNSPGAQHRPYPRAVRARPSTVSSVGRAAAFSAEGPGFESLTVHCGCGGVEPRGSHDPETPFESDIRNHARARSAMG